MKNILYAGLCLSLLGACINTNPNTKPSLPENPDPNTPDPNDTTVPDPVVNCDPVANTGCDAEFNESCAYSAKLNAANCVKLEINLEHEENCNQGANECGLGLTCTALPTDEESTCHRVCDPATQVGCDGLPGRSSTYTCMALRDRPFGVCVGGGLECNPNFDPCPASETCSLLGGRTVCMIAGEALVGENCSAEPCIKGAVCVTLENQPFPVCYQPCDTGAGICPNNAEVCTGLDGLDFGICQNAPAECDPLNDTCGDQNCSLVGTRTQCTALGSTPVGGDCSTEPCAAEGVCARLLGEAPKCFEPCNLELPECSGSGFECSSIGLAYGICL